jgi:saccharopine dehydrogenase-like NADP-dependent oxidoreductase
MMKDGWQNNLPQMDILLDCLPGKFAPQMAQIAKDNKMHYVNLTEYVHETKEIQEIAKDAETGFALQCGLAPGFVNVVGLHLFNTFLENYDVSKVNDLEMRVGALTRHATSPHFYGFTWSPIGVATEYIKDSEVVKNGQLTTIPSLSDVQTKLVDGTVLEEDFTSGGVADLPFALDGKVKNLNYKTFRYPGHYGWVKEQLSQMPDGLSSTDKIDNLEKIMLSKIPSVEDDTVVIYTAVEGLDSNGVLRRLEESFWVDPIEVGNTTLRAIQATTAAGMAEAARILLTSNHKGVLLQSQFDTEDYLSGPFVSLIYE